MRQIEKKTSTDFQTDLLAEMMLLFHKTLYDGKEKQNHLRLRSQHRYLSLFPLVHKY